jgi:hypothetical protein
MFGRLEVKVPLLNLPDHQSDGDLRFEYDLMTKLLEAVDVITGQTLGFEAIEEVTAQINVRVPSFKRSKVNEAKSAVARPAERKFLGLRGWNRCAQKMAVWAIAHRLCRLIWKVLHEGVHYVELGPAVTALTLQRRKQRLVSPLKKLGYSVQLMPRVWQVVSRDAKASCYRRDEGGPLGAVL